MSEEEGLAQVLWIADPDHTTSWSQAPLSTKRRCRAMARAALDAIGGTEAALRTALAVVVAAVNQIMQDAGPEAHISRLNSYLPQAEKALSLPPSAAAEMVLALVYAAARALGEMRAWSGTFRDSQADSTVEAMESLRSALDPFLLDEGLTEEQGLLYDQNWRDDRYAQVQSERNELAALRRYRNARVALEKAAGVWHQGMSGETRAALLAAEDEMKAAVADLAPFEAAKSGGGAGGTEYEDQG